MNFNEIALTRELILKDSATVRKLLITRSAIKLYEFCRRKKGALTYQVAKEFNISIQSAIDRLDKLYVLRYLSKSEVTQKSGRIEYVWYAVEL